MDWNALQAGLVTWFAALSGISADDIAFVGEPIGAQNFPRADLVLKAQAAAPNMDEVRYIDQGADTDLGVELVGNRTMVLSCKVRTRDQHGNDRAQAYLEKVRDRLELPSSQAALDALGVAIAETLALVDVSAASDHREESIAVLDIALNYVADVVPTDEGVGTIEHAKVSGTAHDGATIITVDEQTIPPV